MKHNYQRPTILAVTAIEVDMEKVESILQDLAECTTLNLAYQRLDREDTDTLEAVHAILLADSQQLTGKLKSGATALHTIVCPYLQQRRATDDRDKDDKVSKAHLN